MFLIGSMECKGPKEKEAILKKLHGIHGARVAVDGMQIIVEFIPDHKMSYQVANRLIVRIIEILESADKSGYNLIKNAKALKFQS